MPHWKSELSRKLDDNNRATNEHMKLFHGRGFFLAEDMSELKTKLEKIYAICDDNVEDRAEYCEADGEEEQEDKEDKEDKEEIKHESQGSTSGSDCTTGSVTEDSDAEGE
jgi:hypothetical protein